MHVSVQMSDHKNKCSLWWHNIQSIKCQNCYATLNNKQAIVTHLGQNIMPSFSLFIQFFVAMYNDKIISEQCTFGMHILCSQIHRWMIDSTYNKFRAYCNVPTILFVIKPIFILYFIKCNFVIFCKIRLTNFSVCNGKEADSFS